ncbi:MAG TPA: hypothetical protein VE377_09085 [Candidatus Dormibacteraeota bacterium]|nr:hypothetical protein [Candidatus Dormibacteraeota bacterium]
MTANPLPPPVAYAYYETTGPNAKKANAFVRPSTHREGWFRYENTFGEKDHGPRGRIAKKYLLFSLSMKLQGYQHKNSFSADPVFTVA